MPRKAIGDRPLTPAERQARAREKQRETRERQAQWIAGLDGVSTEDPLRRAAQMALRALDDIITADELTDDTGAVVAYEALCAALAPDFPP